MQRISKFILVIGLAVPLLGILLNICMKGSGEVLLQVVLQFVMVGCTAMMAAMWFCDNMGKWLNGFDEMSAESKDLFCNSYGMYATVAMLILDISLALGISGRTVWFILIVPSVILILYPLRYIGAKEWKKKPFLADASFNTKVLTALGVCLLASVPLAVADDSSSGISIEFGTDSLHVKAPMFDHDFLYSDIEDLQYEPDFDKGSRRAGFATTTLDCGKYKNAEFGNYELASYSKVKPCVTFTVDGKHYAFNDSTAELTLDAYNMLLSKV